ncbi:MAG: phosphohistidine phosphatase SixA [Thermoguttaceae bacterium]|jgi:phosphohistidine phosphatase
MDMFIIRHAWAGQFGDPAWPNDSQRPLTEEGRRRFARMAARLAERGLAPEIIATSPMVRCVETARALAENVSGRPEVAARDELLPDGDVQALVAWTAQQAEQHEQIAWVGHAPDVGRLAAALIGPAGAAVHFSKGAVAAIRFEQSPQLGQGELRWLVTAKLLDC